MTGNLYLVSVPIGNYDDITIRALNVLKDADLIVCEELKEARRLLSNYKIEKELLSINEHNEKENSPLIIDLLKQGKNIALISDCGTPLFSDPGHYLLELCIQNLIKVTPVPGASSLLTALVASNFNIEKFYYYGWLSPKKERRKQELINLKKRKDLIIFMDTPYRLQQLIEDISNIMGNKNSLLAFELTKPGENFFRGSINQILHEVKDKKLKGEFVFIFDNR